MAIMARMLGIPTVTGVDAGIFDQLGGETVILDGDEGVIYINPDGEMIRTYERKAATDRKRKEGLKALLNKPACTKSGREIKFFALFYLTDIRNHGKHNCQISIF